MKWLLILMVAFHISTVKAQSVYKSTNGNLHFYSDAPLEDIEAVSKTATSAISPVKKEVAVLVKLNSFKFDNSLMQEHFNENYLESDKYPNATYQGKILDSLVIVPGTSQQVKTTGTLTIHGVTKPYTFPVNLRYVKDGSLQATGEFFVKVADHDIKVPQLVFNNIAETVKVTFDFKYLLSK